MEKKRGGEEVGGEKQDRQREIIKEKRNRHETERKPQRKAER